MKQYTPYKTVLSGILLLSLLVAVFWPVIPALYHDWVTNNNNSHCVLVPFISMYLIWRNRQNIDFSEASVSYIGLIIMVASLTFYMIGYAGRIDILPRMAFVTAIIGTVLYNYGSKIFSVLAFPLFFLFFMIPVPVSIEGIISFSLQLWVTQISSAILSFLSITVLREGNILQFANCSLEVAEACSGIRSLTAFIMLGSLFAYMLNGSWLRRSIMILLAIPLAFLVNILRVVGTGILASFFGAKVARGFLHEFSGIAVFLLGLFIFSIIYQFLDEENIPSTE